MTTRAFGESMTGMPATSAMHFRNGAVAFAYMSTLLMEFVDEHKVSLNDTIDRFVEKRRLSRRSSRHAIRSQATSHIAHRNLADRAANVA